jgi:hypothetical protein
MTEAYFTKIPRDISRRAALYGEVKEMLHSVSAREARQRREISGARVATPILIVLDTLERELDHAAWSDVRQDAVEYYVEWMLCRSLPRVLDSLPLAELDALPGEAVQRVTLLLLRDLFRHHAGWIQTAERGEAAVRRVDALFAIVAAGLAVALDEQPRYALDDLCDDAWAVSLCAMVGIHDPVQVARLFVWHAAITTAVQEGIRG